MRVSRDLILLLLVFAVLIGLTSYGAYSRARQEQESQLAIPYSTHSSDPTGALALKMWLEAEGFRTERIEYREFAVRDDMRADPATWVPEGYGPDSVIMCAPVGS